MKCQFVLVLLLLANIYAADNNEVSLEDVIKQILQISPPEIPVGKFRDDQQPPKHMLELYRRFTSGRRASGETVRSITPATGKLIHLIIYSLHLQPA